VHLNILIVIGRLGFIISCLLRDEAIRIDQPLKIIVTFIIIFLYVFEH
jgi:hypothetical protein